MTATLTTVQVARRALAQAALDHYFQVACHEDQLIARCDQDVYKTARAHLLSCIEMAYEISLAESEEIYAIWLECNESLNHCHGEWIREKEYAEEYANDINNGD